MLKQLIKEELKNIVNAYWPPAILLSVGLLVSLGVSAYNGTMIPAHEIVQAGLLIFFIVTTLVVGRLTFCVVRRLRKKTDKS